MGRAFSLLFEKKGLTFGVAAGEYPSKEHLFVGE